MSSAKELKGYCKSCKEKKKVRKDGDIFRCLDCDSIVRDKFCNNCQERVLPEDKKGRSFICPICHGEIDDDTMRRQGVR